MCGVVAVAGGRRRKSLLTACVGLEELVRGAYKMHSREFLCLCSGGAGGEGKMGKIQVRTPQRSSSEVDGRVTGRKK
jgi:hypothetical protein